MWGGSALAGIGSMMSMSAVIGGIQAIAGGAGGVRAASVGSSALAARNSVSSTGSAAAGGSAVSVSGGPVASPPPVASARASVRSNRSLAVTSYPDIPTPDYVNTPPSTPAPSTARNSHTPPPSPPAQPDPNTLANQAVARKFGLRHIDFRWHTEEKLNGGHGTLPRKKASM